MKRKGTTLRGSIHNLKTAKVTSAPIWLAVYDTQTTKRFTTRKAARTWLGQMKTKVVRSWKKEGY